MGQEMGHKLGRPTDVQLAQTGVMLGIPREIIKHNHFSQRRVKRMEGTGWPIRLA